MARLTLPRAASATLDAYTQNEGEIFFDTTADELRVGDGVTAGGKKLAYRDGSNFTSSVLATLNGVLEVATKSALQALTANIVDAVVCHGRSAATDGYGGLFVWRSGDQSAAVAVDPQGAIYVPPDSDPDGSSGAWMRVYSGAAKSSWFGTIGSSNDTTGVQAALNWWKLGNDVEFVKGVYTIDTVTVGPCAESLQAKITGAGPNVCRFVKRTNDGAAAVIFNGAAATTYLARLRVEGISFEGFGAPAVDLYSLVRSLFVNCRFKATAGAGVKVIRQFGCISLTFFDCESSTGATGYYARKYTAAGGIAGYPNFTRWIGGGIFDCSETLVDVDDGKEFTFIGVDLENGGTAATSNNGNVLVGANIGSEDSVEAIGVSLTDCWIEAGDGDAALIFKSGLNKVVSCNIAANPATYDIKIDGGRYFLENVTARTSKTTCVLEDAAAAAPNFILNCNFNGALSVSADTFVFGSGSNLSKFPATISPTANDGAALGTGALSWSDLFLASGGAINWANGGVTITHNGGSDIVTFAGAANGYFFDFSLLPTSTDAGALGGASNQWADLFLAAGGAINWANGGVTITHNSGSDIVTFAGAANGYFFDFSLLPTASDAGALGGALNQWSDLFLASGGVVNFNNGNVTLTHSANALAIAATSGVSCTGALSAMSGTAIPAGGTAGAGLKVSSTPNFGVFFGSGAPTLSAAKGSLYLRSDGSGTGDRAYINTDGGTTWTALTTAA